MRPVWTLSLEGGPRRVNHSAVMIGHRIFMFGGYCSGEDYETIADIDIYVFNTISYCWKKVRPRQQCSHSRSSDSQSHAPYMRYGHSSVAIGEKAYLFGGRNDSLGACKTLYYFDTDKLEWCTPAATGQRPGARDGHAMCEAKGNIYVYGGYEAELDRFSEDTFKLDIKKMTWTLLVTKGHSGMWRDFHTLTARGNKIYLFGGRGDEHGPYPSNNELYDNKIKVLDLDTLQWSDSAKPDQKLPVGRRSHTAFFHNGCLHIFGGYNSDVDEHFNDMWKYDPETGIWSEITTSGIKPCPRRRHCCCYHDNRVYMFGGTSPIEIDVNQNQTHNPRGYLDGVLFDHSDTFMLDFEPSLKTLCLVAVKKNKLDVSCLPPDVLNLYLSMTTNNSISSQWPSSQG